MLFCSLLLFFSTMPFLIGKLQAQDTVTASGVVIDEKGKPIPGVGVLVKGTYIGVTTDIDGRFTITAPTSSEIVFSFIGFVTQTHTASRLKNATVRMKEDIFVLDDIVVVGYGVQKKETLTGAITQIKSSELIQSPVPNLGAALTGRALGVTTYQYSGQPGEDDVIIRIRGNGTLEGSANSAEPLVLVDGVEREFSQLDPNEIESMSILKDAASTAVFGIRGANGVILITTKQGVEGRPRISFSTKTALQQPTRLQTNLDALSYARRYNQGWLNDGHDEPFFTEHDMELFANGSDQIEHPNLDWKDILVKDVALQQQHNMNISGGNSDMKYYVSLGYLDQGGLLKDFKGKIEGHDLSTDFFYKRVNIRSNINVNLTPTTQFGIQIGGIIGRKQATNNPTQTFQDIVYAAPMTGLFAYNNKLMRTSKYDDHRQSPLDYFLTNIIERKSNVINTNLNFNQKLDFITPGLSFRGMGSYDSEYNQIINISNPNSKVFYLVTNLDPLIMEQDGEYGIVSNPTSSYSRAQMMHIEAAIEYNRTLGSHNISGLLLGTTDKKWWHGKDYNTIPISYMGLVGRLTYDYKSRYLIEFNMGYNGSENFPKGNRFALFPAISGGWYLSEENFMKSIVDKKVLTKLKMRASYGVVGNDASGNSRFMYLSGSYQGENGIFYMGSSNPKKYNGYKEGIIGNPNVTWETAKKQNYGVDIGLFENRMTVTAEYFQDDRVDILSKINTEPVHVSIAGQDVYNVGRVKNRGYEIEANWQNGGENFAYWLGATYAFVRNKVIEDGSIADPDNPQLWRRGRSTGLFWIYQADGFFNNQEEVLQGPVIGNPTPGDVRFVDVDGNGIIDSKDVIPTPYPEIPEITYSMKSGFSYKNFNVSVLFQGGANSTKILTGYYKTFNLPYPDKENWAVGNEHNAVRPKLSISDTYSYNKTNSTIWVCDGSYLKLRNVEISYLFDKKLINKLLKLESLRIYVSGQNLYSWDKLKYVDPEMKTNAVTFGSYGYPQLRVFNFGLNLNL